MIGLNVIEKIQTHIFYVQYEGVVRFNQLIRRSTSSLKCPYKIINFHIKLSHNQPNVIFNAKTIQKFFNK